MEDLIPIGRFSAASRLSQKALRLYDANGLLPPRHVDPESGYRYYSGTQLGDATLIALLRAAGMPLARIRRFLAARDVALLDHYEAELAAELADRRSVLRHVRRLLKEEPMYEVSTKRVEGQRYRSRMKKLTVEALEPFIVETIGELSSQHAATGPAFSRYHGAVTEEEDGPVEVGVPTADGDRELPAAEVVFTVATGAQCSFPEILSAYDAVARWAHEHGASWTARRGSSTSRTTSCGWRSPGRSGRALQILVPARLIPP